MTVARRSCDVDEKRHFVKRARAGSIFAHAQSDGQPTKTVKCKLAAEPRATKSETHVMTTAQRLLLETLTGHFALLQENCPQKAKTQTAMRAKRIVEMRLRAVKSRPQRLAA